MIKTVVRYDGHAFMPGFFRYLLVLFALALSAVPVICAFGSDTPEEFTPLLMGVQEDPVPFTGSDGRTDLVYELIMLNFSSGEIVPEKSRSSTMAKS